MGILHKMEKILTENSDKIKNIIADGLSKSLVPSSILTFLLLINYNLYLNTTEIQGKLVQLQAKIVGEEKVKIIADEVSTKNIYEYHDNHHKENR